LQGPNPDDWQNEGASLRETGKLGGEEKVGGSVGTEYEAQAKRYGDIAWEPKREVGAGIRALAEHGELVS
jgi:hypothetical protein